MRIVLASLMCLVLCTAQCWAIKGGPPYPAGKNVVGTYAGVLEPRFDPTDPFSTNSLGIFSLSVPSAALANGTFVMFSHGLVFKGTIQGLGDPNKGTITAILDASFTVTSNQSTSSDAFGFIFTTASTSVTARASGNLNAKVSTGAVTRSGSATLLKGTATVFVTQTASASTSPSPTASPTATPTGGSGGSGGTIGGTGITAAFTLDVAGFKQSTVASAVGATTSGSPGQ